MWLSPCCVEKVFGSCFHGLRKRGGLTFQSLRSLHPHPSKPSIVLPFKPSSSPFEAFVLTLRSLRSLYPHPSNLSKPPSPSSSPSKPSKPPSSSPFEAFVLNLRSLRSLRPHPSKLRSLPPFSTPHLPPPRGKHSCREVD